MEVKVEINSSLVASLIEIARCDAICSEYPLASHVKRRLEARAELRWVQAVAQREGIPFDARDVAQALDGNRPPRRSKEVIAMVRRLRELNRRMRSVAGRAVIRELSPQVLEHFHQLMDPESVSGGGYRAGQRQQYFLIGLPETVPRGEIAEAASRVLAWVGDSELGRTPVLGAAVAHQELMLLTPFLRYTPAVVDAITHCLLVKKQVNRAGLAVLEQRFARDMNEYEFKLRDNSEDGRRRWVQYFVLQLERALVTASKEVLELRQHLEREPWLDAAPLSDRQQFIYKHILQERKATSAQVLRVPGKQATNLRMVQRDLVRLAELGLIEKIGARKDAYYRTLDQLESDETEGSRRTSPVDGLEG